MTHAKHKTRDVLVYKKSAGTARYSVDELEWFYDEHDGCIADIADAMDAPRQSVFSILMRHGVHIPRSERISKAIESRSDTRRRARESDTPQFVMDHEFADPLCDIQTENPELTRYKRLLEADLEHFRKCSHCFRDHEPEIGDVIVKPAGQNSCLHLPKTYDGVFVAADGGRDE